MGEGGLGWVFPELSENIIRVPATIPSSSHTNTSSTTGHTIPPIACTTKSHTHPQTTYHLHHINTTTSTTNSITTLAPIVFRKQPRLKKIKSSRTIPQSLPQPLQPPPPLPHPYPPSSPRNLVPKRQNNPPKSLSQRNKHPH